MTGAMEADLPDRRRPGPGKRVWGLGRTVGGVDCLACALRFRAAGVGRPEDVVARVRGGRSSAASPATLGEQRGSAFLESVGDGLQERQPEYDVLVLRGVLEPLRASAIAHSFAS